jgi:hypothetical protein
MKSNQSNSLRRGWTLRGTVTEVLNLNIGHFTAVLPVEQKRRSHCRRDGFQLHHASDALDRQQRDIRRHHQQLGQLRDQQQRHSHR